MNRGKKVLVAGALALSFLLLRQVYAFIFNGLEGQMLILDLPELRLPRPFSHITLLGDVSTDGIIRNLEIGLPLALSIFLLGAIAALVTQKHLLDASLKLHFLRNLLTALAVGLAIMPALLDASRKVFAALKLRNESRKRIVIPILERVVEIANALGLRLALESKPTPGKAGISVQDLLISGTQLGPVSLEVKPGEIAVLSGPTGSGKSSILEGLAGIAGEYRGRQLSGRAQLGDQSLDAGLSKLSSYIGFIPQNPRELCIGISTQDLLASASKELLEMLGLGGLSATDSSELSEGEIFKLVLATTLTRDPSILILDEPFGSLDSQSTELVAGQLAQFAKQGGSVLLAEHEPNQIPGLKATYYQLLDGQLKMGSYRPVLEHPIRSIAVVGNEQVLDIDLPDLFRGRKLIVSPKIRLQQAECVWLSGDNGSGKSSLLQEVASATGSNPQECALVPENFDDFFVTATLRDELARADKVSSVVPGFTQTSLESILPAAEISSWLDVHPRDLSRGTRLALAIAMQLSHKPKVLLIDEPFRGLDPRAKDQVSETIRCVQETGCAVLFASHEASWAAALASRRLAIVNQELSEIASVKA